MELNKEERAIRAALLQVETPVYDMEGAVKKAMSLPARPRRRALPRAVLAAAALIAALLVGAAATAAIPGLWERFFPNPVPEGVVTTLGVSQTAGGYVLTLEDAMADDNGIILLLTLSRADGGMIDPKARLSANSMHVKLWADRKEVGGGFDRPPILSEDGKSLLFCFEARSNRLSDFVGLSGKTLNLAVDGVAIPLYSPDAVGVVPDAATDLSPLAGAETPDLSSLEHWGREEEGRAQVAAVLSTQDFSIPLPLDGDFPQYKVCGAVTLEEGLAIAISQGRGERGDRVCTDVMPECLIDTRDGSRYDFSEGSGLKFAGGKSVMLFTFRDCPLTAQDLPYLELKVCYSTDQILSEEPFSLTFAPESTGLILPLSESIAIEGAPLHPNQLRLSALGVSLRFDDSMDAVHSAIYKAKIAPVITLKDGAVLSTVWRGGSGDPDACNVGFQVQDENGERLFLDTAQVQSVTFHGATLWTAGDYVLTLEDAMADDNSVLFVLGLTRSDGGVVDPDARLQGNTVGANILVDGASHVVSVLPRGSSLSEDGKTLYFCYEARGASSMDGSLAGKTLTFRSGGVVIPMTASQAFPTRNFTVALGEALPLDHEFPGLQYVGVEMTDEGLAVTVTREAAKYGDWASWHANPVVLTDSRNGAEYYQSSNAYITLPDGRAAIRTVYGAHCPLTTDDAPYVKATYGYALDKVLSGSPFGLSFTAGAESAQVVPLDVSATVEDVTFHLTELRFSPLTLTIKMSNRVQDSNVLYGVDKGPVVRLKDGSTAACLSQEGSGSEDRASVSFWFVDENNERMFLDTKQIASISLGDTALWTAPQT